MTDESVTDAVIGLLNERRVKGMWRYGRELRTGNGRDALWDALEEAADLTLYLMQAIMERDRDR